MKVALVQAYYHNIWEVTGLGYIAAYLKRHEPGIELVFFQGHFDSDETIVAGCVDCDIVGFSNTSPTFTRSVKLAREIKAINPKVWICTGGYHPSAVKEKALIPGAIDQSVVGEGEEAMLSIVRGNRKPVVFGRKMEFAELFWPDREFIKSERCIGLAESITTVRMTSFQSHRGCPYRCLVPETLIQMADGKTKAIGELIPGDIVVGVKQRKSDRWEYEPSIVKHVWKTMQSAYRITLADGKSAICSADHRWLTRKHGWKYTTRSKSWSPQQPDLQRPYITTKNNIRVMGIGGTTPFQTDLFKRGYLTGMIRGDAHFKLQFRLALADPEALDRTQEFLLDFGIKSNRWPFKNSSGVKPMEAVTVSRADHEPLRKLMVEDSSPEWLRGFLSGIFDAEGSCSTVIRITNNNQDILRITEQALDSLSLRHVRDVVRNNGVENIRVQGGVSAIVRFFNLVDPAIIRKFTIFGTAVRGASRIVSIEPLGIELPMIDIETTTETFIANGMVSHNCAYCLDGFNKALYPNMSWKGKELVRHRDIDECLDELEYYSDFYNLGLWKVNDPTWNVDPKWCTAFCNRKYERGIRTPFYPMIHAGMLTEDLAYAMAKAGCVQAAVGCESGSDKVLKDIGKGTTVKTIKRCFGFMKAAGIKQRAFFILGMDDETYEDIALTEKLADELEADEVGFTVLCPYPGVRQYTEERFGGIDWTEADEYSSKIWSNKHLTNEELRAEQTRLSKKFSKSLAWHAQSLLQSEGRLETQSPRAFHLG